MENIEEKIDFIDEFLRQQEDILHGIEGKDCTKSRKYLIDLNKQFTKLFSAKDIVDKLKDCKTLDEAIKFFNLCSMIL